MHSIGAHGAHLVADKMRNHIHCGDVLDWAKGLPDGVAHAIITSPPYWGLRDYGTATWEGGDPKCQHKVGRFERTMTNTSAKQKSNPGSAGQESQHVCPHCGAKRIDAQLGLEPDPETYITKMVEIFHELRRVLRDDGVLWLNMGSSYAGSGRGLYGDGLSHGTDGAKQLTNAGSIGVQAQGSSAYKPLDLIPTPWLLALALQADGWYLRSDIVWAKPNPMPESVNGWRWEQHRVKVGGQTCHVPLAGTHGDARHGRPTCVDATLLAQWRDCPGCPKCEKNDGLVLRRGSWRPTKAHEMVFMLTKTANYFCDAEAVREASIYPDDNRKARASAEQKRMPTGEVAGVRPGSATYPRRNLRSVWTIPTQPFSGAHFACFPEKLAATCIKASCSERGCCPKCGAQYARVIQHTAGHAKECPKTQRAHEARGGIGAPVGSVGKAGSSRVDGSTQTLGFRPTCECGGPESGRCLVADPFMGSGTVALVARKLGHDYIGCDLSPSYCKMAE